MRDDWQPGDIALCIREPTNPEGKPSGVVVGQHYTVAAIFFGSSVYDPTDVGWALALVDVKPPHPDAEGFNAEFFRKIGSKGQFDSFMKKVLEPVPGVKELEPA